jgi:hypothetical protein
VKTFGVRTDSLTDQEYLLLVDGGGESDGSALAARALAEASAELEAAGRAEVVFTPSRETASPQRQVSLAATPAAVEEPGEDQRPASELAYFVRLRAVTRESEACTFKERPVVSIGSAAHNEVRVLHDLIGATHAEIAHEGGLFVLRAQPGEDLLLNGARLEGTAVLCRGDEITLVERGGPSFKVAMLKPDRPPGRGQALPRALRWLAPVVEPAAGALQLPASLVLWVGGLAAFALLGAGILSLSLLVSQA